MERLLTYLKQTPEGEIADTAELEGLLAECWDEFVGDYGGLERGAESVGIRFYL